MDVKSELATQKVGGRPKLRPKGLKLERMEGAGAPAQRTPKATPKQKSNRASARSASSSRPGTAHAPAAPSLRKKGSGSGAAADAPAAVTPKSTPKRSRASAPAAAAAASSSGGGDDGSRSGSSNQPSAAVKALAKLELTASELLSLANGFDATAVAKEGLVGSTESLTLDLGNLLLQKMTDSNLGMKEHAMEFFRELDGNGDGSVTRMEFKQCMRKLGLLGGEEAKWAPKDVDRLFDLLDDNGDGELDVSEIITGCKRLKSKALKIGKGEEQARAEAAYWRGRAQAARDAAEQVGSKESMAAELLELREHPSPELRLANLLARKQIKPADIIAKMDADHDGSIDVHEFMRGMAEMGFDGDAEEVKAVHASLDKDSNGMLSLDEIKAMVMATHSVKERAKEQEATLSKDLARAEAANKDVLKKIRAELIEDQVKKEKEEAERALAEAEAKAMAEAQAVEAKARIEAKAKAEREQKEAFEKRIQEKRKAAAGAPAAAE